MFEISFFPKEELSTHITPVHEMKKTLQMFEVQL
jgi:hypothetical protein